jgi:hypothetical protein
LDLPQEAGGLLSHQEAFYGLSKLPTENPILFKSDPFMGKDQNMPPLQLSNAPRFCLWKILHAGICHRAADQAAWGIYPRLSFLEKLVGYRTDHGDPLYVLHMFQASQTMSPSGFHFLISRNLAPIGRSTPRDKTAQSG